MGIQKKNRRIFMGMIPNEHLALPVASFGRKVWRIVAISSDGANTYLIYSSLKRRYKQKIIATGPIDLAPADTLVIGNGSEGNTPVKLLRRFEVYSSSHHSSSNPNFLSLVNGKKCRDVTNPPFCEESYLSLTLEPSFIAN